METRFRLALIPKSWLELWLADAVSISGVCIELMATRFMVMMQDDSAFEEEYLIN